MAPSRREQLAIGDHRVPRPQVVCKENPVLVERVTLQELLGLLTAVRLVDNERPAVVTERTGDGELTALAEACQILPMYRPQSGDLGLVLQILDDRREFHESSS